MGCFSFICKECGKPINSADFEGEYVELFLLKDGEVIEHMRGKYDSYGRVFTNDLKDSVDWKMAWVDVCNLMHSPDRSNGIAAVHTNCYNGVTPPGKRSMQDPNQGFGDEDPLHLSIRTKTEKQVSGSIDPTGSLMVDYDYKIGSLQCFDVADDFVEKLKDECWYIKCKGNDMIKEGNKPLPAKLQTFLTNADKLIEDYCNFEQGYFE